MNSDPDPVFDEANLSLFTDNSIPAISLLGHLTNLQILTINRLIYENEKQIFTCDNPGPRCSCKFVQVQKRLDVLYNYCMKNCTPYTRIPDVVDPESPTIKTSEQIIDYYNNHGHMFMYYYLTYKKTLELSKPVRLRYFQLFRILIRKSLRIYMLPIPDYDCDDDTMLEFAIREGEALLDSERETYMEKFPIEYANLLLQQNELNILVPSIEHYKVNIDSMKRTLNFAFKEFTKYSYSQLMKASRDNSILDLIFHADHVMYRDLIYKKNYNPIKGILMPNSEVFESTLGFRFTPTLHRDIGSRDLKFTKEFKFSREFNLYGKEFVQEYKTFVTTRQIFKHKIAKYNEFRYILVFSDTKFVDAATQKFNSMNPAELRKLQACIQYLDDPILFLRYLMFSQFPFTGIRDKMLSDMLEL